VGVLGGGVGGVAGGGARAGLHAGTVRTRARNINNSVIDSARKNITDAATRGGFDNDIYLGRITPKLLKDTNNLRDLEGVVRLDGNQIYLPQQVGNHLLQSRGVGQPGGYTPQQLSDTLISSIFISI